MKRLVVAGCSFSDYTQVPKVYGEWLSEEAQLDYYHLAGGCGSNDRSFRLITSGVNFKQITSDDHIIIQLTSPNRLELFSTSLSYSKLGKLTYQRLLQQKKHIEETTENKVILPWDIISVNDPHGTTATEPLDLVVSRWKMDSHMWQESFEDKKLHQTVQDYGTDLALGLVDCWWKLSMLRAFLDSNNIQHSVLWHWIYIGKDVFKTLGYTSLYRDKTDIVLKEIISIDDYYKMQLSPDDSAHLSTAGHKEMGKRIYKVLNEKGCL